MSPFAPTYFAFICEAGHGGNYRLAKGGPVRIEASLVPRASFLVFDFLSPHACSVQRIWMVAVNPGRHSLRELALGCLARAPLVRNSTGYAACCSGSKRWGAVIEVSGLARVWRTAGRKTRAASMQQPTPSVRQKPSPTSPRWLEIIKVPKPIMVVRALTRTPRPIARLSTRRPSTFGARSRAIHGRHYRLRRRAREAEQSCWPG